MQVTVTIPDEVVTQARARGLTPESYVEKLVVDTVRMDTAAKEQRDRTSDMNTFFLEMAANSEKIPQLPDEAFTRGSFYRDHD
jgi:hypothetical protein